MNKVEEAVRRVMDAAREMTENEADPAEYERTRKEHEEAVAVLIAAVRAEERAKRRTLEELRGAFIAVLSDHERAGGLFDDVVKTAKEAAIDEFRAKGLTCPHCERRIEEWPLPT